MDFFFRELVRALIVLYALIAVFVGLGAVLTFMGVV